MPVGCGRFDAYLGTERVASSTSTPLLTAARRLLDLGFPKSALVVMKHAVTDPDGLRGRVGDLARIQINGTGTGFFWCRASPIAFEADPLLHERKP